VPPELLSGTLLVDSSGAAWVEEELDGLPIEGRKLRNLFMAGYH
jgi:hypothetical protein